MLMERFSDVEMDRYVLWKRFKINKAHVRRVRHHNDFLLRLMGMQLINYSLSQSVPAGIVTAVNGCAKIFVVDLIERALDVQMEWQSAASRRPDGKEVDNDAELKDRTMMLDRGPLTPDHLREALRRYKKERTGQSAGVMGVSLKGIENVAPKGVATKNLFRKM
jgi:transcription initiation factor TFIID subunit 11